MSGMHALIRRKTCQKIHYHEKLWCGASYDILNTVRSNWFTSIRYCADIKKMERSDRHCGSIIGECEQKCVTFRNDAVGKKGNNQIQHGKNVECRSLILNRNSVATNGALNTGKVLFEILISMQCAN